MQNSTYGERRTVTMGSTVAAAPRVEVSLTTDDFGAFFRAWRASVIRFFQSRGVPPDDADDLAQTAFVALLVQWDELAPEAREGRLWTIAHHRHVDYLRRDARWRDRSVPLTEVTDPPCPASDPASVVVRLEAARQVRVAVQRERPEHQRLLHGRYVEHRSYEEIAGELGTTAGALRNAMARAHDRLRERLDSVGLPSLTPSLPFFGWRWTRRGATQSSWIVAAGQGALVSLVATTMIMAPPAAVPAAAAPPLRTVADEAAFDRPTPLLTSHNPTERKLAGGNERPTKGSDDRDGAEGDFGRQPVVPLPEVFVPPVPDPPCVGYCAEPAETVTVHLPLGGGDVSRQQNVAPVCRHVPTGQPVVTCREEEGTNYAVSPSPRPVGD
jgi:RNA polymerase sigma-70 factor (ECF subfamily)